MAISVPPAVNFQSPINALVSLSQDQPTEGRQQIAAEILWATMGGTNKAVAFNLSGLANIRISQISALKIDNSACGADVQFIFPDTSEVITIPGGSPYSLVPVFSNSLTFYVYAPNASPEDIIRFIALNYQIEPAEVDAILGAAFSAGANATWALPGPVTANVIPAGVNGTLRKFLLSIAPLTIPSVTLLAFLTLRDGAGTVFIPTWRIGVASNMARITANIVILDLPDINVRFRNGLFLDWTVTSGGTGINWPVNTFASYTQP